MAFSHIRSDSSYFPDENRISAILLQPVGMGSIWMDRSKALRASSFLLSFQSTSPLELKCLALFGQSIQVISKLSSACQYSYSSKKQFPLLKYVIGFCRSHSRPLFSTTIASLYFPIFIRQLPLLLQLRASLGSISMALSKQASPSAPFFIQIQHMPLKLRASTSFGSIFKIQLKQFKAQAWLPSCMQLLPLNYQAAMLRGSRSKEQLKEARASSYFLSWYSASPRLKQSSVSFMPLQIAWLKHYKDLSKRRKSLQTLAFSEQALALVSSREMALSKQSSAQLQFFLANMALPAWMYKKVFPGLSWISLLSSQMLLSQSSDSQKSRAFRYESFDSLPSSSISISSDFSQRILEKQLLVWRRLIKVMGLVCLKSLKMWPLKTDQSLQLMSQISLCQRLMQKKNLFFSLSCRSQLLENSRRSVILRTKSGVKVSNLFSWISRMVSCRSPRIQSFQPLRKLLINLLMFFQVSSMS